jgi:hypothetical protein
MCRPVIGADDAAAAVAGLGLLPAAVHTSRLVACWPESALHVAPTRLSLRPALMILDATLHDHLAIRCATDLPGCGRHDLCEGPEQLPIRLRKQRDAPLPDPVSRLLTVWRSGSADTSGFEALRVCSALERAGYRVRWASRRVPDSAPRWARSLAPLMR